MIIYAGDGGLFKVCSKCEETKGAFEFVKCRASASGLTPECKECRRKKNAEYYAANREEVLGRHKARREADIEASREKEAAHREVRREQIRAANRKHYQNNQEEILVRQRERYAKNKDAICERVIEYRRSDPERWNEYWRRWREENPDKALAIKVRWLEKNPERAKELQREYARRKRSTIRGKIENSVRGGIRRGLIDGAKAGRKTFDLLPYSVDELRDHLEKQFLPGMSWGNYGRGGWHIDHIIPLSVFKYKTPDDEGFKAAWALTNLRPLWESENHKKGGKRTLLV